MSSSKRWRGLAPALVSCVVLLPATVVTASAPSGVAAAQDTTVVEPAADRVNDGPSRGAVRYDPIAEMEALQDIAASPAPPPVPRYRAMADPQQVKPKPKPKPTPTRQAPQAPPKPDAHGSCGKYSGNRATGCAMLVDKGWELDQMECLEKLWTKESGWNELAENPSSGAYGIPQSLPGDKMASAGSDWQTNPVTQIKWGLGYIQNRYGTPCDAWGHSQATGWY